MCSLVRLSIIVDVHPIKCDMFYFFPISILAVLLCSNQFFANRNVSVHDFCEYKSVYFKFGDALDVQNSGDFVCMA